MESVFPNFPLQTAPVVAPAAMSLRCYTSFMICRSTSPRVTLAGQFPLRFDTTSVMYAFLCLWIWFAAASAYSSVPTIPHKQQVQVKLEKVRPQELSGPLLWFLVPLSELGPGYKLSLLPLHLGPDCNSWISPFPVHCHRMVAGRPGSISLSAVP